MKDDLSQKIHGNVIFSVCLVKMVFLFPTNMILSFCQNITLLIFSEKNSLKDNISGIIEKDDIHPSKYGISSDRKRCMPTFL